MKKYILTYNNKQYIENPYDYKSTTVLQQILPHISEEDAQVLAKTDTSIKHKNDINYKESVKTVNVGQNYHLNMNFGNKIRFGFIFKYVLDPVWKKMFQIQEVDLTENEIKIWYPNEEKNKEILKQYQDYLKSIDDSNDDQFYLNQMTKVQEMYPIEKIKKFTYNEFYEFLNYIKNGGHPSTKGQVPDQWGYYQTNDGRVKNNSNYLKNPNFEEFKNELVEILENYEKYQFLNEFELNKKFNYINATVISLYQRSYIYMTKPQLIDIFISKSKLYDLFDYLYNEKGNKNKIRNVGFNTGIISKILLSWLTTLNIEPKHQHNFSWWLIANVVQVQEKNNVNEEENTINADPINYENIFLEDDKIENFLKRLENRKNIIVKGQPGTGKSYSVKEILRLSDFDVNYHIQFSQNTNYNDFIEGYVPKNQEIGFELRMGILREVSAQALLNKDKKYALIIDEINRGNMSNIFGEAFTLIESSKRDEKHQMKLPLSNETFYVPSNVYIVGTMNSVDKSLYNLDYALQRRFEWMKFEPSLNTKLINYATKHSTLSEQIVEKAINKLVSINDKIVELTNEEDYKIGHSFFVEVVEKSSSDNEFIENFNEMLNTDYLNLFEQYELNFDAFTKEKWNGILDNARIDSTI